MSIPKREAQIAELELAEAARRDGRASEAVQHYANALSLDPREPAAWNNLAIALSEDGRPEDAVAAAEMAITLAPSLAPLYVSRGNALAAIGERAAAIDAYHHAIARDPSLAAAHYNLGARRFDDRDVEAAQHDFHRALELAPSHTDARFHYALTLMLAGDLERANAELAHLEPDNPRVDGLSFVRSVQTPATRFFADTFETLGHAVDRAEIDGWIIELGVRRGTSTRWLAARLGSSVIVHGFDSFEGIPVSWGDGASALPRGTYGVRGELPDVPDSVRIHAGWFDESLPTFLETHSGPARLVHVDCDVYESTLVALTLLAPRFVSGTILVFDDYLGYAGWRNGEHRALIEVSEENGFAIQYLAFSPFTHQAIVRVR